MQQKFVNQVDPSPASGTPVALAPASAGEGQVSFPSLKKYVHGQELVHIQRAIELSGGDKKRAAALLGISLATLYRKLEGE